MTDQKQDHEVIKLFSEQLHKLSNELTEMLNEHYSHQTERRGCGYTQATRVFADYVNLPRADQEFTDLKLFDQCDVKPFKSVSSYTTDQISLNTWRNLDINPQVQNYIAENKTNSAAENINYVVDFENKLRNLAETASLEESKLICQMIEDIILPKDAKTLGLTELNVLTERPKVGSCPMAEKFFLKVAHHQLPRQGILNVFVDENNQPVMLEKLNMGDNHSCISLVPLMMNGVRLPAGSLFAMQDYSEESIINKTANKQYKGHIIPIKDVSFWFLRITTLAISPKNRARAFTMHFKQQVQNGLLNPEITELSQLMDVAKKQF